MSKIGKLPIVIPEGVTLKINGQEVTAVGPKGQASLLLEKCLKVEINQSAAVITPIQTEPGFSGSLWGLRRSQLANLITGVQSGFEKILQLMGIGYRAKKEGETLVLNLGFSHPIKIEPQSGIKFSLEGETTVKVTGINRQQVGEVAAGIRSLKIPEPYKGKGIRYLDEVVRKKAGKAGKAGVAFGGK